jgi:amino acid transporter
MPYGINGVLGGAATLFFAYIGFDTVASTAEEVRSFYPFTLYMNISFMCSQLVTWNGFKDKCN